MKTFAKYAFWAVVAGCIIGGSAQLRAHADPGYTVDPIAATYAAGNATRICTVIREFSGVAGVAGVVEGIVAEGLTGGQAGTAIAIAVTAQCPQYWPVLNDFIAATVPPAPRRNLAGVIA